jgi:hypothetical protein
MALTPLYTTSIVYINRINNNKKKERDRKRERREYLRDIHNRKGQLKEEN